MNSKSSVKWTDSQDIDELKSIFSQNFKWRIENFSSLPHEEDKYFESPDFSFADFTWSLKFFPNGESIHSSKGWIGMYAMMHKDKDERITDVDGFRRLYEEAYFNIDFVIGFENIDGTLEFQKGIRHMRISRNSGKGWSRFLPRDELMRRKSDFYPADVLTISAWITSNMKDAEPVNLPQKVGNIRIGGSWKNDLEFKGASILSDTLRKAFLNGEDCDVTFRVRGKIISAHKLILKMRSENLSQLLNHQSTEKNNVIDIIDCEPGAFKVFLLYLYTGKVENLSKINMLDVFYIAYRYNVPDLKTRCISYIENAFSVKNICSIISFAVDLDDPELLISATRYFLKNARQIIPTEEWNYFVKEEHPEYGKKLIEKAMKMQKA